MSESKTPGSAQHVPEPASDEEALQRAKDAMMYWCDRYDQAAADLAAALARAEKAEAERDSARSALNKNAEAVVRAAERAQTAESERDALAAKLAAAERDAERYRWLRNESPFHRSIAPSSSLVDGEGIKVLYTSYGTEPRTQPIMRLSGEWLDNAIDAARGVKL